MKKIVEVVIGTLVFGLLMTGCISPGKNKNAIIDKVEDNLVKVEVSTSTGPVATAEFKAKAVAKDVGSNNTGNFNVNVGDFLKDEEETIVYINHGSSTTKTVTKTKKVNTLAIILILVAMIIIAVVCFLIFNKGRKKK